MNKLYFFFSISPPPKDNENSNSSSADNMDNMEYGDLEMNLEFDCRWTVTNLVERKMKNDFYCQLLRLQEYSSREWEQSDGM